MSWYAEGSSRKAAANDFWDKALLYRDNNGKGPWPKCSRKEIKTRSKIRRSGGHITLYLIAFCHMENKRIRGGAIFSTKNSLHSCWSINPSSKAIHRFGWDGNNVST